MTKQSRTRSREQQQQDRENPLISWRFLLSFEDRPNTRFRIRGYTAEEIPADHERYEPLTCLACKEVHLVNLKTGEVLTISTRPPPNPPPPGA